MPIFMNTKQQLEDKLVEKIEQSQNDNRKIIDFYKKLTILIVILIIVSYYLILLLV